MIRVLPESKGKVLGVQASERLTDADYETVWIPELKKRIEQYGSVRALLYMDDTFVGWEPAALWDDAQFGLKHMTDFEKIAIVGGPEWVKWSIRMFQPFFTGEVRSFDAGQLAEAWDWIG